MALLVMVEWSDPDENVWQIEGYVGSSENTTISTATSDSVTLDAEEFETRFGVKACVEVHSMLEHQYDEETDVIESDYDPDSYLEEPY